MHAKIFEDGKEDRAGKVYVSTGLIFLSGTKVTSLRKHNEVSNSGLDVYLKITDGSDTIHIHFEEERAAKKFAEEVQEALDKRPQSGKRGRSPLSASKPDHRSGTASPGTSAAERPTQKARSSPDQNFSFGGVWSTNNSLASHGTSSTSMNSAITSVPHSTSTRAGSLSGLTSGKHVSTEPRSNAQITRNSVVGTDPGSTVAEQKRDFDSIFNSSRVGTLPPSYARNNDRYTMRRASPPRRSVVLPMMPERARAPQQSSSYGGYRAPSVHFDGLRNLGNTCYLNAVMQSVYSLREFVDDLISLPERVPPCGKGELFCRTREVLTQMKAAQAGSGPANPARLRERIAVGNPMFGSSGQQDAHEFLLEYISQLHDEILVKREEWIREASGAGSDNVLSTQAYLDSAILKRIECMSCDSRREFTEKFRDFSLDFPTKAAGSEVSLEAMLKEYFSMENIDAKCETCGHNFARLYKYPLPGEWPRVLVLHLKRFLPNIEKRRFDKRHERVAIPQVLDVLRCGIRQLEPDHERSVWMSSGTTMASGSNADSIVGASNMRSVARPLAPRLSDADSVEMIETPTPSKATPSKASADISPPRVGGLSPPVSHLGDVGKHVYDLRAVVAHDGPSPQAGHYVSYASNKAGKWQLFDDSVVRDLSSAPLEELGRQAYILFYVLRDGT